MMPNIVPTGVPQELSAPHIMPQGLPPIAPHVVSKAISKKQASPCLETKPYPDFWLKKNFSARGGTNTVWKKMLSGESTEHQSYSISK